MGKLLDVMDRVRWCRGQLSASSVKPNDFYTQSVGHYATTIQEYIQIGGRHDYEGNLCGAACSVGIIHMAMGNLLQHDDVQYSGRQGRGEQWFKWALTKWALQISQYVFKEWYKHNYDQAARERLGYLQKEPSIIEWNDNEVTKRDDVYKFMSILEQDLTLIKLFKLAELTPPAQRLKFAVFQEMHPLKETKKGSTGVDSEGNEYETHVKYFYNWDEFTNDDIMLIARELMPVDNPPLPYKLKGKGVSVGKT